MALITLRVLDGADRGRCFADMPTPLTIGREEGNPIQLNDERVSRFHVKIQEDQDQIVLTDLQSTNGTKVNGESVPIWVLRPGDVIALGRTLLVFGSRRGDRRAAGRAAGRGPLGRHHPGGRRVRGGAECGVAGFRVELRRRPGRRGSCCTRWRRPDCPTRMSPGQTAQLAEILLYMSLRLRGLLQSVTSKPRSDRVTLDQQQWQKLIDLEARLAGYLRQIGEPND